MELFREEARSVLVEENGATKASIVELQPGGYLTSVILESSDRAQSWFKVIQSYFACLSPRRRMDGNSLFWIAHSPFQYLQRLELVVTGFSVGQHLTEESMANFGRQLALIPLQSLCLHTVFLDPLFNGLVQWPRQCTITDIVIYFSRTCPPTAWKRPLFPHIFHPFVALDTLDLHIDGIGKHTPLHDPHPLFDLHNKGFRPSPSRRGEVPTETVRRVARNITLVCRQLKQFTCRERRFGNLNRLETEFVLCRRVGVAEGEWRQVVQKYDSRFILVSESLESELTVRNDRVVDA